MDVSRGAREIAVGVFAGMAFIGIAIALKSNDFDSCRTWLIGTLNETPNAQANVNIARICAGQPQ